MTLPNTDESQLLVVPGDAYSKITLTHLSDRNVVSDVFERGKPNHAKSSEVPQARLPAAQDNGYYQSR